MVSPWFKPACLVAAMLLYTTRPESFCIPQRTCTTRPENLCSLRRIVLLDLRIFAACDESWGRLATCGRLLIGLPGMTAKAWLRRCCSVGQVGNLRPIVNRPARDESERLVAAMLLCTTRPENLCSLQRIVGQAVSLRPIVNRPARDGSEGLAAAPLLCGAGNSACSRLSSRLRPRRAILTGRLESRLQPRLAAPRGRLNAAMLLRGAGDRFLSPALYGKAGRPLKNDGLPHGTLVS
jgi:hypothetical protein